MAFTPLPAPAYYFDNYFDSIIDCLKLNNALPADSFIKNVPFFNFSYISKEAHVKELFNQSFDQSSYQALLRNIVSLPENDQDLARNMMTFAQICLYKVLPCPDPHCSGRPREIVTHNQYKDSEYECPFYHHDRDRRRIVISCNIQEDFVYKANYYEADRSNADRENYSKNYFESMFHPLYYKMFRCKREYCNSCQFCPFYHHEQEKKTWDKMFNTFLNKDRITYVKDKQKYYESSSASSDDSKDLRSSDDESATTKSSRQKNQRSNNNNRYQNSPKLPHQNQNGYYRQAQFEGKSGKFQQFSDQKVRGGRKDSGDSFQMNVDSFNKQIQTHRMC